MNTEIEIYCFENKNMRIIGDYINPWFAVKDICSILELTNVTIAINNIPEKWRGSKDVKTGSGIQEMLVVNEAGLYKLIMRSNKPIASKFQEWVCEDILPSIRKKGNFVLESMIEEKNQKLEKLESENKEINRLILRKNKRKYKIGNCVYILTNKNINQFKIGKSDDINKRMTTFNGANPDEFVLYKSWYTRFNQKIESLTHDTFESFRISMSNEWFEMSCLEKVCDYITKQVELMEEFDTRKKPEKEPEPEFAEIILIDDKVPKKKCTECLLALPYERFYLRHEKMTEEEKSDSGNYRSNCKKCYHTKTNDLRKKTKKDSNYNKKTCTQCKNVHKMEMFYKTKEGLHEICKTCYNKNNELENVHQCVQCMKIINIDQFHTHTKELTRNICKECRNEKIRSDRKDKPQIKIKCEFCNKDILEKNKSIHQKTKICLNKQGKLEGPLRKEVTNYRSRIVVQMDKSGIEIAKYKSVAEASKKTEILISNISSCCRGIYHTAGGYKWKFE